VLETLFLEHGWIRLDFFVNDLCRYNLLNLVDHFHRRGLYRSIFLSIMEGEESLQKFSPQVMIKESSARSAVSLLPHIILFHGTSDYSIPSAESQAFADA